MLFTHLNVSLLLAEGHVTIVLLLSRQEGAGLAVHLDKGFPAGLALYTQNITKTLEYKVTE